MTDECIVNRYPFSLQLVECLFTCSEPEISGCYFVFWSDCRIFHSLIPLNALLPSLIHLCQWLNPVQSDTRACG